ncbi:hypothetical protein [Pontibacter litorisediminis]|uniref:hypothetical protein n=1 Tax=Pontibacter litorisediminis TaxID=1846260 RepID=UPI0023EC2377|nr:hypothetical protein [Pontibacter litorisediminis]
MAAGVDEQKYKLTPNPSEEGNTPLPSPLLKTGEGAWLKLRQLWLSNQFPVFGLSAYASFSGDERERGSPRHEGRKSSQRDALIEGPYPQDEPSRAREHQSQKCNDRLVGLEDERQLVSIAWFKLQETAAKHRHKRTLAPAKYEVRPNYDFYGSGSL